MSEKRKPINEDFAMGRAHKNVRESRIALGKKSHALMMAHRAEKAIKSTSKTDCGISAKEAEAMRNKQYWDGVRSGKIDDNPPMPDVIKALMLRDELDVAI